MNLLKQKMGRKLLSFLLTLAMVIGLMPGMGLTAYAITDTYTNLIPTASDDESALSSKVVKFNSIDWYIIKDDSTAANTGTVTLLAKEPVDKGKFNNNTSDGNHYNGSVVKGYLDGLTGEGGSFADVADAIVPVDLTTKAYNSDAIYDTVTGAKLWLLSTSEVKTTYNLPTEVIKCSNTYGTYWWLRSPGGSDETAACGSLNSGSVYDYGRGVSGELGVRPALQLDLSKVVFDSTTKTFSPSVSYPLLVGGVQVTSANATDTTTHPTWSYAADTNTLTLSGYTFSGEGKGVEYTGDGELKIVITGQNSITSTTDNRGCIVGNENSDLNLSGTGSLTLTSANGFGGIYNGKNITIESGTVTATGKICGIRAENGDVTIKDGKVTAKGNAGIVANNGGSVTINGADVTATGSNIGIYADSVSITGSTVTATGSVKAINGTVKNAIAGTGWTDTDGTQGRAAIPVSTDGQSLESYKKVQFPSVKAAQTITASDVTATYGDTDKSVSASTNGNGAISYAVKSGSEDYIDVASDGKLTINKVPTEGKAYVTVTAAETTTGGTGGNGYAAATKDVTVNISKATVTITAKDQSIYVGGTVPTLSGADFYTITGLVGTDTLTIAPTLTYQKDGSVATPVNTEAGTYDIVPSGAGAGDNYNISYTNGTLKISEKQKTTVTKAPEAKTLTYTGSAQELVTTGTATGGTMQYALGTKDAATGAYSASIPTATDVGTYYVWYKVVGDENHNDTKPVYVTALINEKKITPSISTEKRSILYTGQPQELVTPGEAAGGTMVYAIGKNDTTVPTDTEGWSEDIPTGTDPGTYYVWYKVKGDGDHLDSDPVCVIVTITKLTVDMKPVPEGKTTSVDTSTNPDVGESLANEAKALAAENDTNVELYLSVAPKGQSKATESEVLNNDESMHSKVQSQFKDENSVSVDVLDIYIKQTIKGVSSDLKETTNVLEIGIGYDFTGKYDPVVVRKHGETAEVFKALSSRPAAGSYEDARFYADTANNKLYIYSDKFSTYVVAYSTEENNAQNRTTASSGGSSSSSTTASYPTTVPVYRLFNTVTGQHFYTANKEERDLILEKNAADGWTDEGIAFETAQKTSIPVYRVFDLVNGNHIFTTDAAARDLYIANGYRDEGIAWYAPAAVGRKVYKLTDAKSNKVTYTTSKAEADSLVDLGFTCEDAEFVVY